MAGHVSKGKDKKIFSHTAKRTRAINLKTITARGGIRL